MATFSMEIFKILFTKEKDQQIKQCACISKQFKGFTIVTKM